MKTTTYITVTQTFKNQELGEYISFGISAMQNDTIIKTISDISLNIDTVNKMTELFNKYNLSPIHFSDAVEDLINTI